LPLKIHRETPEGFVGRPQPTARLAVIASARRCAASLRRRSRSSCSHRFRLEDGLALALLHLSRDYRSPLAPPRDGPELARQVDRLRFLPPIVALNYFPEGCGAVAVIQ